MDQRTLLGTLSGIVGAVMMSRSAKSFSTQCSVCQRSGAYSDDNANHALAS